MLPWAVAFSADPLTGRWQVNGDGAVFDIVEAPGIPGELQWRYVDGADLSITPGTVVGTARRGASPGLYDCRLNCDPHKKSGVPEGRTVAFTATLDATTGDNLVFHYYKHRRRISLWRVLPYLFRITVESSVEHPAGLEGARRADAPQQYIVL
ncbi:MAG: hypothetical protein K2M00_08310 [Muribaculaceae bacterium]|nr:hypothetical protein [Muribaculaceae bacterium]